MRRFFAHKPAVAGLTLLLLLATLALAAGPIASAFGIDPDFMIDLAAANMPPSAEHWLGTDALGQDIFILTLFAARVSLGFGLAAALLAALVGTTIGLLAGTLGGRADSLLMRLTDGVIALPLLPLLIVLAAIDPEKLGISRGFAGSTGFALGKLVLLIALVGWTKVARLVRAGALAARARDYVRAARALGAGPGRVMLRHILPNVAGPVIVATSLSIGLIILLEATLSFLGFGLPADTPSWGRMLRDGEALIFDSRAPWLAVFPGLALFATVISFNFLGDGLQDALDPRGRRG
jgi:peptide/nickel transport system permease protein